MPHHHTPQVLSFRFSCLEEFLEGVAGFDLDFTQLEAGQSSGAVRQLVDPRLQITYAHFDRSLRQRGVTPKGFRTFGIPLGENLRMRWRGRTARADHFFAFPTHGELEAVTGGGFKVFTFSIQEEAIAAYARATRRRDPLQLLKNQELFRCPKPLLDGARRWLRAAATGPSVPDVVSLEEELAGLVFRALEAAVPDRNAAAPLARRCAVSRAEEYVRDQAHCAPSIAEICRAAGCSERTLQYAFHEYLGVTPKAYLQAERLKKVRQGLHAAEPRTGSVSDVANAWGFWHMGQFAADYRRMFGELPSTTLQM